MHKKNVAPTVIGEKTGICSVRNKISLMYCKWQVTNNKYVLFIINQADF